MSYYLLFLNNLNNVLCESRYVNIYKLITIFVKLIFDINILVSIGYFIGFLLVK